MKTWMPNKESVERKWWLVDATNQTVGRLATEIANVLRGKNKAEFAPHVDCGDFVVVINAEKVKFTGAKDDQKKYYRRSRFFGSLKETSVPEMIEKNPTHVLEAAVKGMLPKNRLSRQLIKKLKAYPGSEHPHDAQKPQALSIN